MKNLKFLSFALLFWVLIIAWCEKANNQEKVSCEGDDVCPVEETVETPSIEVEETPSVVVETNDEEWDLDWNGDWSREEVQAEEPTVEEPVIEEAPVVEEESVVEE